jgi:membrane-associated phospholipid phosphatase
MSDESSVSGFDSVEKTSVPESVTKKERVKTTAKSFLRALPWIKIGLAASYFGLIWPLYILVNHTAAFHHLSYHVLKIRLDTLIPFQPRWIFAYASMYAIVSIPFLLIRNNYAYLRMWFSLTAVGIIAYFIFLIYPTYDILRPVTQPGGFSEFFLGLDNKHDSPYNCFPSLHVGFSMTAALWVFFCARPRVGIPVLIWGILVSVSVLFVKEHYFADLVGGMILSIGVSLCLYLPIRSRIRADRTICRHGVWVYPALILYSVEVIYAFAKYSDRIFKYIS